MAHGQASLVPHLVVGFSSAVMIFLFARIMPARTEKVPGLRRHEGLAMYIGTAESARLAMVNLPEETPTLSRSCCPTPLPSLADMGEPLQRHPGAG